MGDVSRREERNCMRIWGGAAVLRRDRRWRGYGVCVVAF